MPEDERDEIHSRASDHQKQFIYLPLHVFEEETNAEKLMYKEAKKSGQDLDKVKLYVLGLYPYLHAIHEWHPFMKNFKFNDDQINDTEKIGGEPKELSNKTQRPEPASSSKRTDVIKRKKITEQIPSTSKQANVYKGSKTSEKIPDTSKKVDSATSKKSTDIRRSPRKINQNKENDDGNQAHVTRTSGKRQVNIKNGQCLNVNLLFRTNERLNFRAIRIKRTQPRNQRSLLIRLRAHQSKRVRLKARRSEQMLPKN